jgi:hypothetical protein
MPNGYTYSNLNLTCTSYGTSITLTPWTISQARNPITVHFPPIFSEKLADHTFTVWQETLQIDFPMIIDPTDAT